MSIVTIARNTTYQREYFSDAYFEMEPLIKLHYDEINLFGDPVEVDINTYVQSDEDGVFKLYTMRSDGELVGYAGFFIYHHPHHLTVKHASQDFIFIRQDKRGHGTIFVRYCESELKTLGVDIVLQHVPAINDWSLILKRIGYRELETTYFRRI